MTSLCYHFAFEIYFCRVQSQPIFNENLLIPNKMLFVGVLNECIVFFFIIGHLIISKYATFLFSSWAAAVNAKCCT